MRKAGRKMNRKDFKKTKTNDQKKTKTNDQKKNKDEDVEETTEQDVDYDIDEILAEAEEEYTLGGDAQEVDEGPESTSYDQFVQQIASLEGKSRFIHQNKTDDLKAPLSQLLGQSAVSINDLLPKGSSKAVKKALVSLTSNNESEDTGKQDKSGKKRKASLKLPTPLSNPEESKAKRRALYSKAKSDLNKWNSVVQSQRIAPTVTYPLENPDMKLITAKDWSVKLKPKNELEEQVMSLLSASKTNVPEGQELSAAEESALAKMTLREAEEKRKELMKLRALQSYHEAKLKRQNKIKSKKYRKLMRKMKDKKRVEELEELERTNPELALEEMKRAEKSRILERASLRHRNNSQYLKTLSKRSQKDKESGKALQEELRRHRELTAKSVNVEEEELGTNENDESDVEEEKEADEENEEEEEFVDNTEAAPLELRKSTEKVEKKIDPEKFLKTAQTTLPEMTHEDDIEGDDEQITAIAEAFADDDVGIDFRKEKEEMAKEKKSTIDLTLPGWGSWGGKDIKVSQKKRKRFTIPIQQKPENPLQKKDNLIITDKDQETIRKHQVNKVPFPFTSVKDFEASIRTPVGDTFVPRTAFKKLVQPKVKAKIGAPIDPMDKSVLLAKN